MKKRINRRFAPPGLSAAKPMVDPSGGSCCTGCFYLVLDCGEVREKYPCTARNRPDGHGVIYVPEGWKP
jgi:hypothetical protein